jgi:hypothetical protein
MIWTLARLIQVLLFGHCFVLHLRCLVFLHSHLLWKYVGVGALLYADPNTPFCGLVLFSSRIHMRVLSFVLHVQVSIEALMPYGSLIFSL